MTKADALFSELDAIRRHHPSVKLRAAQSQNGPGDPPCLSSFENNDDSSKSVVSVSGADNVTANGMSGFDLSQATTQLLTEAQVDSLNVAPSVDVQR